MIQKILSAVVNYCLSLTAELHSRFADKTLPNLLWTQALTTLTSTFGLVWLVWFGRFSLVGSVW